MLSRKIRDAVPQENDHTANDVAIERKHRTPMTDRH